MAFELKSILQERKPDYLIVHHMEPDHSANIQNSSIFIPDARIVGNNKTFGMIEQFFPNLDIQRP